AGATTTVTAAAIMSAAKPSFSFMEVPLPFAPEGRLPLPAGTGTLYPGALRQNPGRPKNAERGRSPLGAGLVPAGRQPGRRAPLAAILAQRHSDAVSRGNACESARAGFRTTPRGRTPLHFLSSAPARARLSPHPR